MKWSFQLDPSLTTRSSIHLLRKSSELQWEGYLVKKIMLSWFFRALWNLLYPHDKISSIVLVIHNDPQLITGWTHGNVTTDSNPHLNIHHLPKILNFTTDMKVNE